MCNKTCVPYSEIITCTFISLRDVTVPTSYNSKISLRCDNEKQVSFSDVLLAQTD